MNAQVQGCRALIVGSSSGIGREIGVRLAELGANVAFHGRRADRLDDAVKAAGGGHALVADVADPAACEDLVRRAVERLGGIDLVVYAASASRLALTRDLRADDWARLFAINVIGPAMVTKAALPHLSERAIIGYLSSESVGLPYHGLIPYGSSKAALEEIIRGFRVEHPEFRFCCLRVGQTQPTDFARDFDLALAGELMPKWAALGRLWANSMDVVELGTMIADSFAIALSAPSVEVQDMVLRPAGGPLVGSVDELVDNVAVTNESVYGSEGGR